MQVFLQQNLPKQSRVSISCADSNTCSCSSTVLTIAEESNQLQSTYETKAAFTYFQTRRHRPMVFWCLRILVAVPHLAAQGHVQGLVHRQK